MQVLWSRTFDDHKFGECDHERQRITLAEGLTQAERRCTLTHELVHLERGPVPRWLQARKGRLVEEESSRRHITLEDLVAALLSTNDTQELADELWVDVPTLQARLRCLTDDEHYTLTARLLAAERHL